MNNLPTISAVLITWNRASMVCSTVARLKACPAITQIIVVDNGSRDGTPGLVRGEHPSIELIARPENGGIAAYADGFARATGDLVFISDDDAWPEPDALCHAAEFLRDRADVGMVAFNVRHPETHEGEWGALEQGGRREDWYNGIGCGMLIRRATLAATGGYADQFFLYYNDLDLALRVLGAGEAIVFDPAWLVWHAKDPRGRDGERSIYFKARNIIWLGRMHFSGWRRWSVVANALLGAVRRSIAGGFWRAMVRGVRDGFFIAPPPCATQAGQRPEMPGIRAFLHRHSLIHRLGGQLFS